MEIASEIKLPLTVQQEGFGILSIASRHLPLAIIEVVSEVALLF